MYFLTIYILKIIILSCVSFSRYIWAENISLSSVFPESIINIYTLQEQNVNLSERCRIDAKLYHDELLKMEPWALRSKLSCI